MKVTGKQQTEYFDIFEVQFSLGFITVQGGNLCWLVSLELDWADDPDDRKSTAGYFFSLGSGPITSACKKQQALSLSSAEVEYQATINASQEALSPRQILSEFEFE